jgi:hypothetical protein
MTCMFRDCFAVAQNGFRGAPNCFLGPRGDVHNHTRARGRCQPGEPGGPAFERRPSAFSPSNRTLQVRRTTGSVRFGYARFTHCDV